MARVPFKQETSLVSSGSPVGLSDHEVKSDIPLRFSGCRSSPLRLDSCQGNVVGQHHGWLGHKIRMDSVTKSNNLYPFY